MTKTITQDKTILVLAFAATFIAGAAVFGVFSDYEAEAKPKDPKPPFIDPIFKPLNFTLNEIKAQIVLLQEDVDLVTAKQDLLSAEIAVVDDNVDDIKSEQAVSKNILCGIATSPAGCIGP
jgi:hypothetical protein